MSEKQVRIGSGIRLGRKQKLQDSEANQRIAGRDLSGGSDQINGNGAVKEKPAEPQIERMANIFKKNIGISSGTNFERNAEGSDVPPQFPEPQGQQTPSEIFKKPTIERLDPVKPKQGDLLTTDADRALDFEVPAIEGINKATGNYVLTLGYPGSGKTVLQSFIYYYIATHGAFSSRLERHRTGAQPNHLTQSLLNTWVKDWSARKFPQSTRESVDAIREIRLQLTPRINTTKSFNFSFVEISGELIKSVIPTEVQPGSIVETMHNFLIAAKSKKMIVYVFDHNENSNNDELFSSLIQYLESAVPGRLDKFYSLMVVVPNPDLVFQRISSDERLSRTYSNINELTPEAMLHYLRLKAPQLVTTFRYWKKSKRGIFKFHIGTVSENAAGEQILESYDFKDSNRIIDFCYQQFQRSKLTPRWFDRLKKAFRA